jgi:predicted ATPase
VPKLVLDYIAIEGFKSLRAVRLELRSVNVLIGANGSGKSNFIGMFEFLHAIREGRLQNYVRANGGADQVLHFGSKVTKQIRVHASFENEKNQYAITLQPTRDDSLFPSQEEVSYWERGNYPRPYQQILLSRSGGREAGISDPEVTRISRWVKGYLAGLRVYHVHDTSDSSPLRKSNQINDNAYLRPDGSNLAAFLYLLRVRYEDAYRLIRNTVQRVAPFFDDFLLRPDPLNQQTIRLEWKHQDSDKYFGASALSDGTLRFIALATLFLQPAGLRPSVILVDEPELGLHPLALTMLASLVKQAAVETEVIVSTQSALLLDHFQPEDVVVADRIDGQTQLTRLEPEPLVSWLEDYSLGQLWEKNELGGRPTGRRR